MQGTRGMDGIDSLNMLPASADRRLLPYPTRCMIGTLKRRSQTPPPAVAITAGDVKAFIDKLPKDKVSDLRSTGRIPRGLEPIT